MRACAQSRLVTVVHRYDERLGCAVAETRLPANDRCGAGWLAEASTPWLKLRPHPHLAGLYGVEGRAGEILLLSEPVNGPSLGELLEQGPLSAKQFERLVRELGSALRHAHSERVMHGSLNPAAIAFDEGGALKLLRWPPEHLDSWSDDWSVGPAPFLMHYQAPEQLRAEMSLQASDVYAMGALLYRLTTGQTPFSGPDLASLCYQILREPAPPLQPSAGYPANLAEVVASCLSKEPAARPAGIPELVEALYPGSYPARVARLSAVSSPCQGGNNRPRPDAPAMDGQTISVASPGRRRRARKSRVTIHNEESMIFDRMVTVSTLRVTSGCTAEWLARAAGRWVELSHPGIVPIYRIEGSLDRIRILSEPVDAPDLQEFFEVASGEGRRLAPLQFRKLVVGLTRAMQYAHDRRVLHGALSPECVVLDKGDSVKLLRFSAEHLQAMAGAGREARPLPLLAYQAPEQFHGTTTAASDVYAVGMLLYRVAAGRLPFQVADPGWMADRIAHRMAPVPGIPAYYPSVLKEVVAQCLSADPSQRPSSMLSILYRLYPDEEGRDRDEARQRRHRESLRGMEVGHYEAARADWAELCQENPADGESANNLGVALSRLGRQEEACEAFRHAIQLRPSCPVVAFNLGWALYESGRKQAAIEALDRALALGSSPRALHVRGLCRGGQPAVSDFLAALRNDPQQTISYLALADELEALEQHEDARLMRGQAEEQLLPPREIWPELLLGSVEVPPHWSGGQNWPPRPSAPEHETNLPEDDDSDWDEGGSDDDGGARVPLRRPPHAPSASEAKALPHPYEISRHDPRYLRRAEEG